MRSTSFLRACALALLLAIVSCSSQEDRLASGSSPGLPAHLQPGPAVSRSLPAVAGQPPVLSSGSLPAPAELAGRAGSFTQEEGHKLGSQLDSTLPNNKVLQSLTTASYNPDYIFGEGLGETSYALYSFSLPDAGAALSITFTWGADPDSTELYYLLANFDTNRWDWFRPADSASLNIEDSAPYIEENDSLILGVLLAGTSGAVLNEIQILSTLPPQAVLEADVTSGLAPLSVSFDASGSSDPDGTITNFEWDFDGDGVFSETDNGEDTAQGSAAPPAVSYNDAGVFNAAVRVSDDQGAMATATIPIDVNGAPSVHLQVADNQGPPPFTALFTALPTDDGSIVDYEWDFDGDGNFNEADNGEDLSQGQDSTSYQYDDAGVYEPAVRVTDDKGATATDSTTVSVGGNPLVTLNADPPSGPKPLQVDFTADASDDGSIANYEWDLDGDGLFGEAGPETDAAGLATAAFTYINGDVYNPAVRVTDNEANTASDSAEVTVINMPPNAVLQASVTQGAAPLSVDFDASASTDSDDVIADFEWDLDGDGIFSEPGAEQDNAGMDMVSGYVYSSEGSFTAQVRVSDEDSGQDTASVQINVSSWTIVVIASGAPEEGTSASMALIGGNPAVAYRRSGPTAQLRYASSSTATGGDSANWSSTGVRTDDCAIYGTSLADVSGRPAIAFQDSAGILRFVRQDNFGTWSSPDAKNIQVDNTSADTGRWPSLKVVGGNPAIGYVDFAGGNLRYVRCTAADGGNTAAWAGKITAYDGTSVDYSDMQLVSGQPAMVFADNTAQILRYVRSTTANGDMAADWTGATLCDIAAMIVPANCALTVANGNPAVAYVDSNADIRFARCSTATGSSSAEWASGSNALVAGHPTTAYSFSRANFLLGAPVVAYSDLTSQDQYFSLSSNANGDGAATWSPELVDGASSQRNEASNMILLSTGAVAMCYHDLDGDDLIYAYRNN